MTALPALRIAGIGAWAPGAPDWTHLAAVLRGEARLAESASARPAGAMLPAAERRRAPDSVRLAIDVAAQACRHANMSPNDLPCVFASSYGELGITDYVCATLARAPLDLSPTKFHNSVLNAPAGYWTIATGCTRASSAVTAHRRSFAAGLLEAATLACADATPVLFACCDVAATGPLAAVIHSDHAFGAAMVLAPDTAPGARLRLALQSVDGAAQATQELPIAGIAGDNPANADALALMAALAATRPAQLSLSLSRALSLDMEITP